MRAVGGYGTGTRAQIPGRDVAGKTGTTSDYRDAWFCGVTGNLATVVWMGRDDNTPMRRITGGSAPAELWREVMSVGVKRLPTSALPPGPPPPAPLLAPAPLLTSAPVAAPSVTSPAGPPAATAMPVG